MTTDSANAYEAHALDFLRIRDQRPIGKDVVQRWAQGLDRGADVLELGAGGGDPVSRVLLASGVNLWAVDSSPTLAACFKARFPEVPIRIGHVQTFDFFQRTFDAVVAVGLVFLLRENDQRQLLHSVSASLHPGGRFLFTAPEQAGSWTDSVTQHECLSLGKARYEAALTEAGLRLAAQFEDEGKNNYYEAKRL